MNTKNHLNRLRGILFLLSFFIMVPKAHADITSNLNAWWKLDEGTGTATVDSSGNNNTGTFRGVTAPTWTTSGIIGNAVQFNGADGSIVFSTSSSLQITGDLTVSAWINFSDFSAQRIIVGKYYTTNGSRQWQLATDTTTPNKIRVDVSGDGATSIATLSSALLSTNKWYQVAFVYTASSSVKVYVNGAQSGTTNTANVPVTLYNGLARVAIGNRDNTLSGATPNGDIDDVRVYARALSASDITEIYNTGLIPHVTTNAATSVATTTATLNGTIDLGLATSTTRGFIYGTSTAYGATTTEAGTFTTGTYSANVTGLAAGTTYHFLAYASNATGTGYATNDVTFTTNSLFPTVVPTVTTLNATSATMSSLTLGGSITDTGGADSSQSGFIYGTSSNLANPIATTTLGSQSGTATFSQTISGLVPNTTYYFKAYATNSAGMSTSSAILSATTLPASGPSAVQDLFATASSTYIGLTWNAPTSNGGQAINDYLVEYKLTSAPATSTWSVFNDGISTATSTIVTGLTQNVSYDFRVSALNPSATGTASNIVTSAPFTGTFYQSTVFTNGQDGYPAYRIPAIITAPNGDLLAFAEGRATLNDFGDIDVVMKRSTDGGKTWGALNMVASNGTLQAGNPGIVTDYLDPAYPQGRMFLFYNTGNQNESTINAGTGVREIWYKTSVDNGLTWSTSTNITKFVARPNEPTYNSDYNFVEDWRWNAILPGSGIQMQIGQYKGRIVIGDNYTAADQVKRAYDFYSDDHGATWNIGASVGPNTNENQIVELADGRLMMNARNYNGQPRRAVGISNDGGQTWASIIRDANLPDPTVEASIERYTLGQYHDQNRLLFLNPASTTARANLTIKMSTDEGTTWGTSHVIESNGAGYSDLTILKNGNIGALYEYSTTTAVNYAGLKFAGFDLGWLALSPTAAIQYYPSLTATTSINTTSAQSGDVVTYTTTITNASNNPAYNLPTSVAAQNVNYKMNVPTHLKLLNGSIHTVSSGGANASVISGNLASDSSIEVNLDSLAPGSSYTMTYQAKVLNDFTGTTSVASLSRVAAQNWDIDRSGTVDASDATTTSAQVLTVAYADMPIDTTQVVNVPHLSAGSSGGASSIPASLLPQNPIITTPAQTISFAKNLSTGMSSPDVKFLQQFLNIKGFAVSVSGAGSAGKETTFFGAATRAALARFQKANGISPAVGYFGPVTRAFIANMK